MACMFSDVITLAADLLTFLPFKDRSFKFEQAQRKANQKYVL